MNYHDLLSSQDSEKLVKLQEWSEIFSIIPLRAHSKLPAITNWQKYSFEKPNFKEEDFIEQELAELTIKNSGIVTGPASNLIVLDVDHPENFESYLKENNIKSLPETFTVKTRRGYHYYFQYPNDGCTYKSRKMNIFDIQANGSYVVSPFSEVKFTDELTNQIRFTNYEVVNNSSIVSCPKWIEKLSRKEDEKAIEKEINNIETLPLHTLPIKIQEYIEFGKEVGSRSEAVMSVLISLCYNNYSYSTIQAILETYPIGEKYREKGSHKENYLKRELDAAKKYLEEKGEEYCSNKILDFRSDYFGKFKITTFLEIDKSEIVKEWIVENYWEKGDCILIAAKAGVGKSIFVTNLAYNLIAPPENGFLGTHKIPKPINKILFVQAENSTGTAKERSLLISQFYNIEDKEKVKLCYLTYDDDIRVSGSLRGGLAEYLVRIIDEYGFEVVIIDPLISFHDSDENNNTEMRKVGNCLTDICKRTKASICLIHHSGKSQAEESHIRGAQAIKDWGSFAYVLVSKKNSYVDLKPVKKRSSPMSEPIKMRLNNHLVFEKVDSNCQSSSAKELAVINSVQNSAGKELRKNDLVNNIKLEYKNITKSDISESSARRYLQDMISSNVITEEQVSNGSYKYSYKSS